MEARLARLIDDAVLRWAVYRVQLRRRTLWPDPDLLAALRAGRLPPLDFGDPGPPRHVALDAAPRTLRGRVARALAPAGGLSGGPDRRLRFPSTPPFAQDHDRWVTGWVYEPEGPARAGVVAMPGAFTGSQFGADMGFYHRVARAFTRIDCRFVLLDAPLHGRRARPGERSGHDLLHGDLFTYVRGIAQAVRDARAALGWLHADVGPVGYWGLSLGALVGAVTIVRDTRPSFTVLVQPPLGRDEAMQSVLTRVWREQLETSGVTNTDINAAFDLLHTNDPPAPALDSILIQAARFDTVASPRGIAQTWERWGRPPISWYDHSHTSIFLAGDALIAEAVAFAESRLSPSRTLPS